jgi:hypothetical protein
MTVMRALLRLCLFLTVSPFLLGQNNNPAPNADADSREEVTRDGLWSGYFKGGSYLVRCNQILALSKHEYIADGTARVVEVNLALSTHQTVRFYYLEPVRLEGTGIVGVGQQAIDRARSMVQDAAARVSPTLTELKVVKNYPASTHAHTVEFILKDEARLIDLHASLERSFRTGQGRNWRE